MSAFAPLTAEEVVWEGRPTLGVMRQDVWAGLATLAVCWGVLGAGLVALFAATPRQAFQLGGVAAAVVATIVTLARALGASARIHGALAGFLAVTALAGLAREGATAQVVCCGLALFPVGAALGWRARVRQRTRYTLARDRGAILSLSSGGEPNHMIQFAFDAPPRVHADPFGRDLADVSFQPREARLVTRNGKVFSMRTRLLRFARIKDPERLVQALEAAA
ncbi:MAG: hypothetical protein CMF76_10240 [Maricaulis sp.]|nr:hypothetical protein [Maricaulis sp.]